MHFSPLFRAVGLRRSRRSPAAAPTSVTHTEGRSRHPAMAGIDVPPVHGRHCICERCERQASPAA